MKSLPKNLLSCVLERLPSESDYVRFSSVCKLWNSVAKENLTERTRLTGHPLLLAYTGEDGIWNLCDIRKDKVLDVQLELPDKRFCGFSKGWLITMDENFSVTLIDPFSKIKGKKAKDSSIIKLPPLNLLEDDETDRELWSTYCDHYIFKATISADPVSNAEDYIVLVIHEGDCCMAYIRPHKDSEWTYIKEGILDMRDVVYVQDRLYSVDCFSQLHYFAQFAVTTGDKLFDINNITGYIKEDVDFKRYLVEVNGYKDPLLVKRYMFNEPNRGRIIGRRLTKGFEIIKYDAEGLKWTEINNIGDVALFLGDSSTSVLASEYEGYLPNHIYFIHDWDRIRNNFGTRGPRNFGVYDMGTKKFSKICDTAARLMRMSTTHQSG